MIVIHTETLQFYDCDILFVAEDRHGRKYIGIHTGECDTGSEYKIIPIEDKALIEFKSEQIDLRSLIINAPYYGDWYKSKNGTETDKIELLKQESRLEITEDMPEDGYYLLRFNSEEKNYNDE